MLNQLRQCITENAEQAFVGDSDELFIVPIDFKEHGKVTSNDKQLSFASREATRRVCRVQNR